MAFFEVHKGHDAWNDYVTAVEAESAFDANSRAAAWDFTGTWVPAGQVREFDEYTIHDEDTSILEAATFEEAVKQIHDAYDFTDVRLTPTQRDMVLAALRLWQITSTSDIPDDIWVIAKNDRPGDGFLWDSDIDKLCEEINCA